MLWLNEHERDKRLPRRCIENRDLTSTSGGNPRRRYNLRADPSGHLCDITSPQHPAAIKQCSRVAIQHPNISWRSVKDACQVSTSANSPTYRKHPPVIVIQDRFRQWSALY